MGGLHVEMASLKMVGHLLDNSGWNSALVQADITTRGRADGILRAAHITRSRYAHQVSACALYILQKKAYKKYTESRSSCDVDFSTWVQKKRDDHPQFQFWATVLELELTVLEFVRSIREGNFHLYVEALSKLTPWMFALDLYNYSRWLPVHIRDMMMLKEKLPSVFAEFVRGKFVVQKTQHFFSLIALDHNHEQQNEAIKGDGGAVGLTESPSALRRWMVAGPETARVVNKFESTFEATKPSDKRHHEQVPSVQKAFSNDVQGLISVLEEIGNPFMEDSTQLIALDTKQIMPECVVQAIKTAKQKGQSQYDQFVEERLVKCSKAITDTIHLNKLPLFGTTEKSASNKTRNQISALKNDCNLFARLYIACQAREGNLQECFKHENHASLPSLSCAGKMRSGQKSDLVQVLEASTTVERPDVDVKVFDAAAIVNMLQPGKSKTFKDYATVFLDYVIKQAQNVKRVDLIWDRYFENSLKRSTRETRGSGVRIRVCDNASIPGNWKSFLRSDENKNELFQYLAESVTAIQLPGVEVITTSGIDVLSSSPVETEGLTPCNHEEADTRIFIHVKHASARGLKKVLIRTVDTDVVVLAIAYAKQLDLQELWIAFRVGNHFRYIPVHKVANCLTQQQCEVLPFFHAVTGCDTVSYLSGKGKKTAFQAWKSNPEVTETFQVLSSPQETVSEEQCRLLERFVVVMYSRTCAQQTVNEARQALFAQGNRSIENVPPTQAALEQHVNRAAYQAGHVWGQALEPMQELPSPSEWGWQQSPEGWSPRWTMLDEASKACSELIKCGCKRACRGLCKCTKANLPCTALCSCAGSCYQE